MPTALDALTLARRLADHSSLLAKAKATVGPDKIRNQQLRPLMAHSVQRALALKAAARRLKKRLAISQR